MRLHLFGERIDDVDDILLVKFGRKVGTNGALWADYAVYDGYRRDESPNAFTLDDLLVTRRKEQTT